MTLSATPLMSGSLNSSVSFTLPHQDSEPPLNVPSFLPEVLSAGPESDQVVRSSFLSLFSFRTVCVDTIPKLESTEEGGHFSVTDLGS